MAESLIEKLNNYILKTEELADSFLPLESALAPIQEDFQTALQDLKDKATNADELSDRVFYINRYTDLVKKVEGIFDTRSKRLQQTLSLVSKLSLPQQDILVDEQEAEEEERTDGKNLTPEQANEIIKILNATKE